MKFKITLKDPDGVYEAFRDAADSSTRDIEGLNDLELLALAETRLKKLEERCKQWIQHGEYVTIEIDTDAGTAVVCEV